MCKCQECGKYYKIDFLISDEIWEKIKPKDKGKGAGLLCSSCITNLLENLEEYFTVYEIVNVDEG